LSAIRLTMVNHRRHSLVLKPEGHKMRGSSFPESSASVLVAAEPVGVGEA
jgi:hypothetical protein